MATTAIPFVVLLCILIGAGIVDVIYQIEKYNRSKQLVKRIKDYTAK